MHNLDICNVGTGLFLVEEAEWQRQRKLLAPTSTHPASTFWRRISTPRQEHQISRFLSIFEERLARRAYPRTHGQATSKIRDLDRAHGYRKSDGTPPAVIPSRKRPSTSAAPPAAAFCRNSRTSASFTSGATHRRRHPRAHPFSVAPSTAYLRKRASELRSRLRRQQRLRGEKRLSFLRRALRTRKNIARLSPKTA